MSFFRWLFDTRFMAHVYCYRQDPALVGLHFWSDLSIGAAYVAISLTLVYLVRKARNEIPFSWMFLAFGTFIIACGGTHLMEVWTLWTPVYWFSGVVKALTAAASVTTAFALPPLVPKSLRMLRAAALSEQRRGEIENANAALEREVEVRKRAEEEVRQLNRDLEARVHERTAELAAAARSLAEKAAIVQHASDAIYSASIEGIILSWNPAAEQTYGYASAEIIGQSVTLIIPPDRAGEFAAMMALIRADEVMEPFETVRMRKNGELLDVSASISAIRDKNGNLSSVCVVSRDVTIRKRTEEDLREAQKLENLGLIAGGVAHDFNNLLVGILGNASLALDGTPYGHPHHVLLQEVVNGSERAASLTSQLLAYAGKGRFVIESTNLSSLVRDIGTLITAGIPKHVELQFDLAPELPAVEGDPGQLQQLVMNLVINAAEAIPEDRPGTVRITTEVRELTADDAPITQRGQNLKAGKYVALQVHDNGIGMSDELIARIFDPFFTTKFTGRGLGLAAAQGIVRGHKGSIRVSSIPAQGTTFTVLLPASNGAVSNIRPAQSSDVDLRGTGTILVIDDEESVRAAARHTLERYGYTVLVAADGKRGVATFRENARTIAAVLLDMTMPALSGEETLRQIRALDPQARVILSSGYNEVEAIRRFTGQGIAAFIQKPYRSSMLARVMKQAIAGAAE